MAGNSNLNGAKTARKDEFYTQLTDIEKELRHYRKHFKGKTVFCNCDDPFESNFFKYFVLNFNRLGLKKLIATCYFSSPIVGQQLQYHFDINGQMSFSFGDDVGEVVDTKHPYKAVVTQVYDKTGDGGIDMIDVAELFVSGENQLTQLEGDGDFRSDECLALLDESDIVVTNPPFSLFREYVNTLVNYQKKFIIIGNQNAIKYRDIFPLFMENKIWLGYGFSGNVGFFESPYEDVAASSQHIDGLIRVSGVMWFTNLDIKKRHEEMILVRRYNPEEYPKYVNYDAIEVSRTAEIPCDYAGEMGVPITFMDKYNPEQFELVGASQHLIREISDDIRAKARYSQIGCFYLDNCDGTYRKMYDRIVIRNKHPEQPKEGQQ